MGMVKIAAQYVYFRLRHDLSRWIKNADNAAKALLALLIYGILFYPMFAWYRISKWGVIEYITKERIQMLSLITVGILYIALIFVMNDQVYRNMVKLNEEISRRNRIVLSICIWLFLILVFFFGPLFVLMNGAKIGRIEN